jgi:two-component system response regulator
VDVLLVEDNAHDAELAIHALKRCNLGNRVHTVTDGVEALEFLFGSGKHAARRDQRLPRVILLDLRLPIIDGLEVLRRIKADPRTRTIPVVVLTASREEKDLRECRRLGVEYYIVKPVDFEQFCLTMPRLGLHWLLLDEVPRNGSRK